MLCQLCRGNAIQLNMPCATFAERCALEQEEKLRMEKEAATAATIEREEPARRREPILGSVTSRGGGIHRGSRRGARQRPKSRRGRAPIAPARGQYEAPRSRHVTSALPCWSIVGLAA